MPIIACGINHKTAPVALREKVIFSSEKLALYLNDLVTNENAHEAVVLSTCNRSEIYCDIDDIDKLFPWFCAQHGVSAQELEKAWYCYQGQQAVEHIMRVSCGLDSMIVGEPQITGQLKEAFSESCAAGSINQHFNRLFQLVFSVAKEVRTNTSIGACPVSIASAAVHLAKKNYANVLSEAAVLLIGAGETIELVLNYLQKHKIKKISIANKRIESAHLLAKKFSAQVYPISELPSLLSSADITISATGSPVPLVKKEMMVVRERPLFMIDIAVPRDIDPDVGTLPNIKLFSIDELKNIIQDNIHGREHAAKKAEEVIQLRAMEYMQWLASAKQVTTTIRAYRKKVEDLCANELEKALRELARGENPQNVLIAFAHALTNKLLHSPSIQLRQAGEQGQFEIVKLAQQLLAV